MPEQPVDTLDYLTDEQLCGQIDQCFERTEELSLAQRRNKERTERLVRALEARDL